MKPLSVPGLRVLTLLATLSLLVALPLQAAPLPARQPAPPPDASGPPLFLPLVLGPVVPKSSFELIDAAVKAGRLDDETALVYRAYAITLDPHLPAEYRGVDKHELENDALRDVVRRWPKLSPQTQALLAPFITPPMYEGSWADPNTAWAAGSPLAGSPAVGSPAMGSPTASQEKGYCWSSFFPLPGPLPGWQRLTTAHTSVWYETAGDTWPSGYVLATPEEVEATAHLVASVIENIIDKETKLMEIWPLPDTDEACNGGDGGIDIYVSRKSSKTGGQAVPFGPGEWGRPGFIWIAPDFAQGDVKLVRDALAHEFFHLISMRYPVAEATSPGRVFEYGWLDEASANYMIEYVYHEDQFEHWAAAAYLNRDYQEPLEYTDVDQAFMGQNGYSDYLFILFLAHRLTPKVLRDIWRNTPTLDSLASINEATKDAGGFEKLWPEWALVAWNDWENEFLDDLHRWDNIEPGVSKATNPRAPQEVALNGKRWDQQYPEYKGRVSHLAMGMSRHVFSDSNVRSVRFNNTLVGVRGAFVWALTKTGGKWEVHNWAKEKEKLFCRQLPGERLEELVLLITNSVYDDRDYILELPSDEAYPTVEYSNLACTGWRGTITTLRSLVGQPSEHWEATETDVTFVRAPERLQPGQGGTMTWKVQDGATTRWSGYESYNECHTLPKQADVPLPPELSGLSVVLLAPESELSNLGRYVGTGWVQHQQQMHFVCTYGDGGTQTWDLTTAWWPFPQSGNFGTVSADGRLIEGQLEQTDGNYSVTASWRLEAVEP